MNGAWRATPRFPTRKLAVPDLFATRLDPLLFNERRKGPLNRICSNID
jgi:hypothetical protein